jgi:hypothetical protein
LLERFPDLKPEGIGQPWKRILALKYKSCSVLVP